MMFDRPCRGAIALLFALLMTVTELGAETLSIRWELGQETAPTEIKGMLENAGASERLSSFVKRSIELKSPVSIVIYRGAERYFDRRRNESYIPLTSLRQILSSVKSRYARERVQEKIFVSAVEQMLWFELGRILVSQFALPIQGEEAYALDSFATLMLLNLYENQYLLDAAEEYLLVDDVSQLMPEKNGQSEMEFDRSRYQLILCTVLGKDYLPYEQTLAALAWEEERLLQCQTRYREQMQSWHEALAPYLKPDSNLHRWLPRTYNQ